MERDRALDSEVALHDELTRLGQKHEGGDLGLVLMNYDPVNHDDQRLSHVMNPISPDTNFDTIRLYASSALGNRYPDRFERMVEVFEARTDLLNNIRTDLVEGKNIALITNHGKLEDIPIVQAALVCALGDEKYIKRNAIVVSKILTRLEAFGLPASSVLSYLGHTFFSIPRSKSIFRSGIDNDIAQEENAIMLNALQQYIEEGGKMVAIAPSGSTDERNYKFDDLTGLTLQRMSSGTANLLLLFDRILPVSVWLEAPKGHKFLTIGELLSVRAKTETSIHECMEWIAGETAGLARVTTVYESDRLTGIARAKKIGKLISERANKALH
ncbi:hypothetical protein H0V99_02220 [Candidatus Saccharibacteria bacterium]|nr:hypothetical protein [Candidatus Saccharibacteria bacterium]